MSPIVLVDFDQDDFSKWLSHHLDRQDMQLYFTVTKRPFNNCFILKFPRCLKCHKLNFFCLFSNSLRFLCVFSTLMLYMMCFLKKSYHEETCCFFRDKTFFVLPLLPPSPLRKPHKPNLAAHLCSPVILSHLVFV